MSKILVVIATVAAVCYGSPTPEAFVSAVAPAEEIVTGAVAEPIARIPSSEYQYSYSVHDGLTGDVKNQVERRDGDVVQGSYSLLEADGITRRVVDYSADSLNGFNAVVREEPATVGHHSLVHHTAAPVVRAEHIATPVVRAEHIATPAVHTEHIATPVVHTEHIATPVVHTEHIATPVVHTEHIATPAVRAEHVAAAYPIHHYAPSVRTDIAYAPVERTHVSVTPVVKTEAFQPPPAVSSQSVTHTSHTLHPQPVQYHNHVENVASVTRSYSHEPVAAVTRAEIPIVPTYQTQVAVAPAIHAPVAAPIQYKTYPAYSNYYFH